MAYYFKWTGRLMERFYRLLIIRHKPLDFFFKNLTICYFVHIFIDFSRSWYWKTFFILSFIKANKFNTRSCCAIAFCDYWNYFNNSQTAPYAIQNTPFMIWREAQYGFRTPISLYHYLFKILKFFIPSWKSVFWYQLNSPKKYEVTTKDWPPQKTVEEGSWVHTFAWG